jgi:hypothetical protein
MNIVLRNGSYFINVGQVASQNIQRTAYSSHCTRLQLWKMASFELLISVTINLNYGVVVQRKYSSSLGQYMDFSVPQKCDFSLGRHVAATGDITFRRARRML